MLVLITELEQNLKTMLFLSKTISFNFLLLFKLPCLFVSVGGGNLDFLPKKLYNITFCGQSYKASTIIIYDSRVIPDWKIPHIMTLEL